MQERKIFLNSFPFPGLHDLRLVLISKFSQNFILETHMLYFSRHSRQKCRKLNIFGAKQLFLVFQQQKSSVLSPQSLKPLKPKKSSKVLKIEKKSHWLLTI